MDKKYIYIYLLQKISRILYCILTLRSPTFHDLNIQNFEILEAHTIAIVANDLYLIIEQCIYRVVLVLNDL